MILILDFEATCSKDRTITPEKMEVIELGAVWATPQGQIIETLQRFVRPIERPTLSRFCMDLTHIKQSNIDSAPNWPRVVADLAEFARLHTGQCWGSWGAYDRRQIELESTRHGTVNPLAKLTHINIKDVIAKAFNLKKPPGMAQALKIAGLELEGEHHRALDDARNTAKLLAFCKLETP